MSEITSKPKVSIEARVFRMGPKPRLIPKRLWIYLAKKRIPGTGRWENLGPITNIKTNASITN